MEITPASEVWGVGRKLTKTLQSIGVDTALQLAQMDARYARKRYSVLLERTVCELNGESCLKLDASWQPRQQIRCSRSSGEKLTKYSDLKETVCEFAARAAEKLRRDDQLALMVNVFIRTSPFDKTEPGYIWFGGQRPQKDWFMRQANVSLAYTTRWGNIPEVK